LPRSVSMGESWLLLKCWWNPSCWSVCRGRCWGKPWGIWAKSSPRRGPTRS
jgi:hypothetical protein